MGTITCHASGPFLLNEEERDKTTTEVVKPSATSLSE